MFLLLHRAIRAWDSTVKGMHTKRSSLENNQTEISLVKQTKVTFSLLVLRKYESSTGEYILMIKNRDSFSFILLLS